jgi:hypothetical protein
MACHSSSADDAACALKLRRSAQIVPGAQPRRRSVAVGHLRLGRLAQVDWDRLDERTSAARLTPDA